MTPSTFASARALAEMAAVAASYVRQSSAKSNKTEASPLTQRDRNEKEAADRGAHFLRHFEDIGVSGWNPDAERPGFEAMLKAARAGAFNVLIVFDISRFSRREVMDAIPIVGELHRLGVTIVSCLDGTFAPNDTMALIYLIMRMDAVNKESEHKSQKVKEVKKKQKAAGSWLGGSTPYGFTTEAYVSGKLDLLRLVHQPEEAANIRLIWSLIKTHMHAKPVGPYKKHPGSISSICELLTLNGNRTRGQITGKKTKNSAWTSRTLLTILTNPAIAGIRYDTLYRTKEDGTKTYQVTGFRIHRDEDGRPVMMCEPIIPVDEWFALQAWIKSRSKGAPRTKITSLLSGLRNRDGKAVLRCVCGRPGAGTTGGGGAKPNYCCSNTHPHPDVHKGRNAISRHLVDDYVARRIFAVIQDATSDDPEPGTMEIVTEAARVFSAALDAPETAGERAALVAERADAQNALGELYDDLDAGMYSGQVGRTRFLATKERIEARVAAASARLAEIAEPEAVTLPLGEWLRPGHDGDPIGPGSWWAEASMSDRRTLVELFLHRITVLPAHTRNVKPKGGYDVRPRLILDWVRPELDDEAAE